MMELEELTRNPWCPLVLWWNRQCDGGDGGVAEGTVTSPGPVARDRDCDCDLSSFSLIHLQYHVRFPWAY